MNQINVYLPTEIWEKIFSIADRMMIEEKKQKFREIHEYFDYEKGEQLQQITFLEYNYNYGSFIKLFWTPVINDYRMFDGLGEIGYIRKGCREHRHNCICVN